MVDATTAAAPRIASRQPIAMPTSVDVEGSVLAVSTADEDVSFELFDLADRTHPRPAGRGRVTGPANRVVVEDGLIAVATRGEGFVFYPGPCQLVPVDGAPADPTPPSRPVAHARPNPFGARTTIEVALDAAASTHVDADVYDVAGRRVHHAHQRAAGDGVVRIGFEPPVTRGRDAGGVWFVRVRAGDTTTTIKLVSIR